MTAGTRLSRTDRAGALKLLRSPPRFINRVLGATMWDTQRDIAQAIADHRRVAVKACHASGKTHVAARIVIWWITAFKDAIAITTAPTWKQVERVMWGHIHTAVHDSPRFRFPKPQTTVLEYSKGNYAIGVSTNDAERFAGFRAPKVLIVIDDAQGVRPAIYEAIEGIRAGGDVRVLALGNPTVIGGPFYDAFSIQRHTWKTMTISAFDVPNCASLIPRGMRLPGSEREADKALVQLLADLSAEDLQRDVLPFLTTRSWVLEKWMDWGAVSNPLWDARVMGRFPKELANALVPLSWLESAKNREDDIGRREQLWAGIDVAGPGEDETVLYIVAGSRILSWQAWQDPDPRGKVVAALYDLKDRLGAVKVDSVGMGYYFAKHLRDLGFKVAEVNVGERSTDPERFANLKSELYWGLRMRFEAGDAANLSDETVISQLAGIQFKHDPRGRVLVESKDDMRRRGVLKSPDRAEALMLAYAPVKPTDAAGGEIPFV